MKFNQFTQKDCKDKLKKMQKSKNFQSYRVSITEMFPSSVWNVDLGRSRFRKPKISAQPTPAAHSQKDTKNDENPSIGVSGQSFDAREPRTKIAKPVSSIMTKVSSQLDQ